MEQEGRLCKWCKKGYTTRIPHKLFCSVKCGNEFSRSKKPDAGVKGIPTATVGVMAELLACADLMKKGFELYRAVSPSSYSDLIAIKDSITYPIEVRTGYYKTKEGRQSETHCPIHKIIGKVLIIITHCDNKVHYPYGFEAC